MTISGEDLEKRLRPIAHSNYVQLALDADELERVRATFTASEWGDMMAGATMTRYPNAVFLYQGIVVTEKQPGELAKRDRRRALDTLANAINNRGR